MTEDSNELPLLDHSTRSLLVLFGSGRHTPGAGSGASLSGALAANLLITVAEITIRKNITPLLDWKKKKSDLIGSLRSLEEYVQADSDTFDEVIASRKLRDASRGTQERDRHRRRALDFQRTATEIPVQIGHQCVTIARHGIELFDFGFQAARGDSTTGIALALASAESCVAIVNLNLKDFQASAWRDGIAKKGLELTNAIRDIHPQIQKRVESMTSQWPDDSQGRLF